MRYFLFSFLLFTLPSSTIASDDDGLNQYDRFFEIRCKGKNNQYLYLYIEQSLNSQNLYQYLQDKKFEGGKKIPKKFPDSMQRLEYQVDLYPNIEDDDKTVRLAKNVNKWFHATGTSKLSFFITKENIDKYRYTPNELIENFNRQKALKKKLETISAKTKGLQIKAPVTEIILLYDDKQPYKELKTADVAQQADASKSDDQKKFESMQRKLTNLVKETHKRLEDFKTKIENAAKEAYPANINSLSSKELTKKKDTFEKVCKKNLEKIGKDELYLENIYTTKKYKTELDNQKKKAQQTYETEKGNLKKYVTQLQEQTIKALETAIASAEKEEKKNAMLTVENQKKEFDHALKSAIEQTKNLANLSSEALREQKKTTLKAFDDIKIQIGDYTLDSSKEVMRNKYQEGKEKWLTKVQDQKKIASDTFDQAIKDATDKEEKIKKNKILEKKIKEIEKIAANVVAQLKNKVDKLLEKAQEKAKIGDLETTQNKLKKQENTVSEAFKDIIYKIQNYTLGGDIDKIKGSNTEANKILNQQKEKERSEFSKSQKKWLNDVNIAKTQALGEIGDAIVAAIAREEGNKKLKQEIDTLNKEFKKIKDTFDQQLTDAVNTTTSDLDALASEQKLTKRKEDFENRCNTILAETKNKIGIQINKISKITVMKARNQLLNNHTAYRDGLGAEIEQKKIPLIKKIKKKLDDIGDDALEKLYSKAMKELAAVSFDPNSIVTASDTPKKKIKDLEAGYADFTTTLTNFTNDYDKKLKKMPNYIIKLNSLNDEIDRKKQDKRNLYDKLRDGLLKEIGKSEPPVNDSDKKPENKETEGGKIGTVAIAATLLFVGVGGTIFFIKRKKNIKSEKKAK